MSSREWKKDISLIYESRIINRFWDDSPGSSKGSFDPEEMLPQFKGPADYSDYETHSRIGSIIISQLMDNPEIFGDALVNSYSIPEIARAIYEHLDPDSVDKLLTKLSDYLGAGGNPRLSKMFVNLASIIRDLEKDQLDKALVSDFDPDKNE